MTSTTKALAATALAAALLVGGCDAFDATDLNNDIHATAAYRANLISVQTQRGVAKALA